MKSEQILRNIQSYSFKYQSKYSEFQHDLKYLDFLMLKAGIMDSKDAKKDAQ